MATSGTYAWTLNIAEIIEEAYENCGIELRTGYQLKTAARSLNMLLTEWANDNVHLWAMDQLTTSLTQSTASYTLDARYIDIISAVTRDSNSTDVDCYRITLDEYLHRPDKSTEGRPSQFTLERNSTGGHTLYVWPAPEDSTYSLVSWAIRYAQDTGDYDDNPDIPRRFIPALTFGLAYKLALKNPKDVAADTKQGLLLEYQRLYEAAKLEDRERTSFYVRPSVAR